MRNDAYWTRRMQILENSLLDTGYAYARNLEEQYDRAIKDIETQISAWYQRFAKNNDLSLAEARRLLTTKELKEFRWTVEDYIKYGQENAVSQAWMKELENASARVHISRLDSVKLQLRQQAESLCGMQSEATEKALTEIYSRGYYHTAFEIQKGVGVGWSLQGLTDSAIRKVLSRPWTTDGRTFSDRIWQNKQSLVGAVNTQLTQMIMRGSAPDKAVKAIADRFGVSKRQAGRLVMTESAAFSSMAQKDCFSEFGVEQYRVIASLDSMTCELCGELDNKIYKMSEYATGTTAPPFHPWCRCCTAPYFADLEGVGERFARNADGKTYDVPREMTFGEWKEKFVNKSAEQLKTSQSSGIIKNYNSELAQKFGKAHYDEMHRLIDSCSDSDLAAVWERYESQIHVGDANYSGREYCQGNTIYVNGSRDGQGSTWESPYQVSFHESGHAIDFLARSQSDSASIFARHYSSAYQNGKFPDAIKDEVADWVSEVDKQLKAEFKAHQDDFEWMYDNGYISDKDWEFFKRNGTWAGGEPKYSKSYAYNAIEREIRKLAPKAKADLSDILEGATGGKINIGFGHGAPYWKQRNQGGVNDGLATEAFAEMVDSSFACFESLEAIKKYLPKSYEVFQEMIQALLKKG